MRKTKEQRQLEALARRERDLCQYERGMSNPTWGALAGEKAVEAQRDIRNLRRKLGIREDDDA